MSKSYGNPIPSTSFFGTVWMWPQPCGTTNTIQYSTPVSMRMNSFHSFFMNTGSISLKTEFIPWKAFVRASIEGWKYAFENPKEALDIVLKNLQKEHLPAQRVHQTWMLDKMKKLTTPQGNRTSIGKLHPADFVLVVDVLKDNGLIEDPPRYGDFYRRCYGND